MMVVYDETYLMVKHLPNELTDKEKIDFLKYFGASEVKCLPSKFKKGCVCFARYGSKELAKEVMLKLHQAELLGQLLSVEFVRGSDLNLNLPSYVEHAIGTEEKGDHNKYYQQFLTRLNSWTNSVDFQRPPPVHLRYSYPSPDLNTLTNIVRAVYSIPKLYTQLLHLMNKMNLPCPFDLDFPIECELYVTDSLKPNNELSEGESEIEEDTVLEREILPQNTFMRKRTVMAKRPKLIKPTLHNNVDNTLKTSIPTSQVFEAPQIELNQKKIELKVSTDLSSLKESKSETAEVVQFEPLEVPQVQTDEVTTENDETYRGKVISQEELNSNRISAKDQRMLAVFKNYQAGTPSCRLYIKNLAKNVVVDDLHYIYRHYYEDQQDQQGIMYDVRLMQEGRMKGQAFVTLQGVEQAQKALQQTNGFILHGKPMVVQFARSAKQKPDAKMQTDDT